MVGRPGPNPVAHLPTPDLLGSPPILRQTTPQTFNTDTVLPAGIYNTVRVEGTATLTLQTGVFVFTGLDGLTVADDARVVSSAGGKAATTRRGAVRARSRQWPVGIPAPRPGRRVRAA